MNLLIDTHVALWALSSPDRMAPDVREMLRDPAHLIHVSAVTVWEVEIKRAIGKLSAPEGFAAAHVQPDAAFFSKDLGEFLLPYDAVRTAADPDATLMAFLQSTYDAAADRANWNRAALECGIGRPDKPRPVRPPA